MGKFGPKIQNSKWSLKLKFEYAELTGGVHVTCFILEMPFLGKFGPKNQNCQFEMKIGTKTNLNVKNSMVMFIFPVFDWNYLFLEIGSVSQNSLLKL